MKRVILINILFYLFLLVPQCNKMYGQCFYPNPMQNCELLRNGDFEGVYLTPTVNGMLTACEWWTANQATPDLFFHDVTNPTSLFSIPCNAFGYQLDKIPGNKSYAGIGTRTTSNQPSLNTREILYTNSVSLLQPNASYHLRFDVSLAEAMSFAKVPIHAYIDSNLGFINPTSNANINISSNGILLTSNTSVTNVTNTTDWVPVDFYFTTLPTQNNLKYIVIGAINQNVISNPYPFGSNPTPSMCNITPLSWYYGTTENQPDRAYYYIDNVSLKRVPTILTPSQTICSGQSTILSASGPTGCTFNWYSNSNGAGTPLSTSSTLSVSPLVTTTYYVSYTLNSCTTPLVPVTVTVNPSPVIPFIANKTVCFGNSITLSSGFSSGPQGYSFQWIKNGANISGANQTNYPISSAVIANTGTYSITITDILTGCSTTSNPFQLTVVKYPLITSQPQNNSVCEGSNASFSVGTGTGLSYQWYFNGSPISGATANNYSIPSVNNGNAGNYFVVVTNAANCSTTSTTAILTVKPKLPNPVVTNQTICSNQSVTLGITSPLGTGISYQWYNLPTGGTLLYSSNQPSYTVSPTITTTYYVQAVPNTLASQKCPSDRVPVTVTVNLSPERPKIPQFYKICKDNSVFLSALPAPGQGGFNFSWFSSTGTFLQNGTSYTTPNLTSNTVYTLQVTNPTNGCSAQFPITVLVLDLPVVITSPINNSQVCKNQWLTLNVAPPAGWSNVTYQWFVTPQGQSSSILGNTQTMSTLPPAGVSSALYTVEVTGYQAGEICKKKQSVSVNIISCTLNNNIVLYPNPTNENVEIKLDDEDTINRIILFDINGIEKKCEQKIDKNKATLSLINLNMGVYYINVYTAMGNKFIEKIIKK